MASVSVNKFLSLEEKEKLAIAVSAYRCLCDKSAADYRNRNMYEAAWQSVSEVFVGYGM